MNLFLCRYDPFSWHTVYFTRGEVRSACLFVLVIIVLYQTWSVHLFTCLMRISTTLSWPGANHKPHKRTLFKAHVQHSKEWDVWTLYNLFVCSFTMLWSNNTDFHVGIVRSWARLPTQAPDFSSFAHHYQHLLLPHWNSAWYSDTGRFLAQSVRLVPPLPSQCQAFILSHEAGTKQTNRYFPACVSSEYHLLTRIALAAKHDVCLGIC